MPIPQYFPGYAGALANMYDLDINPEDTSILEAAGVAPGQVGSLMQHLANTALQRRQMALEELMRPYRDIINPDLNRRARVAMAGAGLRSKERLGSERIQARKDLFGAKEAGLNRRAALADKAKRSLEEYKQSEMTKRSRARIQANKDLFGLGARRSYGTPAEQEAQRFVKDKDAFVKQNATTYNQMGKPEIDPAKAQVAELKWFTVNKPEIVAETRQKIAAGQLNISALDYMNQRLRQITPQATEQPVPMKQTIPVVSEEQNETPINPYDPNRGLLQQWWSRKIPSASQRPPGW